MALVFAQHRQKNDEAWEGDMCRPNQILVALSRARERCHVLAEDLRGSVHVPNDPELLNEGKKLGLQPGPPGLQPGPPSEPALATASGLYVPNDADYRCRRQLPWARLCDAAEHAWRDSLFIPTGKARVLHQRDWGIYADERRFEVIY